MNDEYLIQSEQDIETVIGPKIERVKEKVYFALDGPMTEFTEFICAVATQAIEAEIEGTYRDNLY